MAITGTITASGLASGIDTESLVTKLMAVERQPITSLETRQSSYQSKLSAYGTLKSSLSTLQTAAEAINTKTKFAAYTASVADTSVATITTGTDSTAGSYSLTVSQLATAQKVKSAGYASTSTSIGSGTLTIKTGVSASGTATASTSIEISAAKGNNTLSGLVSAINNSDANVTATIVKDGSTGSPYRLVVTSNDTGEENNFELSGLTGFNYSPTQYTATSTTDPRESTPTGTNDLMSLQRSQDAKFSLDGIDITSASNVVTEAISGATLTLKGTNTSSATTVTVASDADGIQTKVNAFIKAYNDTLSLIKSQTKSNPSTSTLSSTDSTTRSDAPLTGDATIRSIQSQLRSIVSSTVGSGSVSRLSDVGIKTNVDGSLTLDSTKFQAALADPTKDVASLFAKNGSVSGIADKITTKLTDLLDTTSGALTTRTSGLEKTIKSMGKQISSLETRMDVIEARYRKQFSAMETTISSMNTTGTYLTQQLSSLLTSYA